MGWKAYREPITVPANHICISFVNVLRPENRPDVIEVTYDEKSSSLVEKYLKPSLEKIVAAIKQRAGLVSNSTVSRVADSRPAAVLVVPNSAADSRPAAVATVPLAATAGVSFVPYTGPGAGYFLARGLATQLDEILSLMAQLYPNLPVTSTSEALMSFVRKEFLQICTDNGKPVTAKDNFVFYFAGWKANKSDLPVQQGKYAYISFSDTPSGISGGVPVLEFVIPSQVNGSYLDSVVENLYKYFDSRR